jgi:hypothetical protein
LEPSAGEEEALDGLMGVVARYWATADTVLVHRCGLGRQVHEELRELSGIKRAGIGRSESGAREDNKGVQKHIDDGGLGLSLKSRSLPWTRDLH